MSSKGITNAFIYELEKLYDGECHLMFVLPGIVLKLHSKKIKKHLNSYIERSGLTMGKLEILFHLVNCKIHGVRNTTMSRIIETSRSVDPILPPNVHDLIVSSCIAQMIHAKISSCKRLLEQASQLQNTAASTILHELLQYEINVIEALRAMITIADATIPEREHP
jgi:ferritin-like metal-binding protein YciE